MTGATRPEEALVFCCNLVVGIWHTQIRGCAKKRSRQDTAGACADMPQNTKEGRVILLQVENLTPAQEPPDSEGLRKAERKLQWRLRDSSDEEVQEGYKQLLADPKPEAALAAQVYKRVLDRRMGQGRGRGGRAGRGGRERPRSVAAGPRFLKNNSGCRDGATGGEFPASRDCLCQPAMLTRGRGGGGGGGGGGGMSAAVVGGYLLLMPA